MSATTTGATMAEARPRGRQPARGGLGAGWKSAILAASLGAVALGWSVLGRAEGVSTVPAAAAAPQVIAAQAPAAIQVAAADRRVVLTPALPRRPVFTQPVARTRAS